MRKTNYVNLAKGILARSESHEMWLTKQDQAKLAKEGYDVKQAKDEPFHTTVPKFLCEIRRAK